MVALRQPFIPHYLVDFIKWVFNSINQGFLTSRSRPRPPRGLQDGSEGRKQIKSIQAIQADIIQAEDSK